LQQASSLQKFNAKTGFKERLTEATLNTSVAKNFKKTIAKSLNSS